MTVFTHLTSRRGILEHLRAYMIKDPDVSDPEHYRNLSRGVQHVIDALAASTVERGYQTRLHFDDEPLQ